MAKAKPQSPRNTPAAQEQGQDQQDTNAQGTTADADQAAGAPAGTAAQGDAATDNAAPESGGQSSGGTGAEPASEAASGDQAGNDANTEVVVLGGGFAAGASAALAAVAEVLVAEHAAPATPEGPVRDEQGRLEYEVVSPLNNGKRHEIGARVWLSDEDAAPLLGHTVKLYEPAVVADEDEGTAHA